LNQINFDNTSTTLADQNFSGGLTTQKAVTQLDYKANGQGIQVHDDAGLLILRNANQLGQLVGVEFVKPYQRGGRRFESIISGMPENVQKNQFIQQTVNFEPTGSVYFFDY
jgi:hypothetical protein